MNPHPWRGLEVGLDVVLRDMFSSRLSSARSMAGLDDLKGLFHSNSSTILCLDS